MSADLCPHCRRPWPATPSRARPVVAAAAQLFGVDLDRLLSPERTKTLIRPRFLAALALRRLGWSLPEIGRALNRDHSTIASAIKMAERWAREPEVAATVDELVSKGRPR